MLPPTAAGADTGGDDRLVIVDRGAQRDAVALAGQHVGAGRGLGRGSDCATGQLASAGGKHLEVAFDVRLYRPKRRLSAPCEAVWRALAPAHAT